MVSAVHLPQRSNQAKSSFLCPSAYRVTRLSLTKPVWLCGCVASETQGYVVRRTGRRDVVTAQRRVQHLDERIGKNVLFSSYGVHILGL